MEGKRLPSVGVITTGLTKCTGKEPICVGKPNPYLINLIVEKDGADKKDCLFIGDKLETDILLGINANIDTLLVFTGETSKANFMEQAKKELKIIPTYVSDNLFFLREDVTISIKKTLDE